MLKGVWFMFYTLSIGVSLILIEVLCCYHSCSLPQWIHIILLKHILLIPSIKAQWFNRRPKLHKHFFLNHTKTWLTAKCGNKSTRSESAKPEISKARGRWSTTAWTGTPLPRPLDPLPLTVPRPREKRPRPRPGARIPLLAACVQTQRHKRRKLELKFTEFLLLKPNSASSEVYCRGMKTLPQFVAGYTEAVTLQCPLPTETSCIDPAQHPAVLSVPE